MMNPFIEERKKMKLNQKQMAKKIRISLNRLRKAEQGYIEVGTACAFCNEFTEYEISEMSIKKRDKVELVEE